VSRVAAMQERRTSLQSLINELDERRQALLRQELARQSTTDVGSFDLAIRSAIRTRAETRGFTFSPLGAPAADVPSPVTVATTITLPVAESDGFDYFVQFNDGTMDTWVANDLVVAFEDTRLQGKDFEHDVHVIPDTPEAAAFIATLPERVQELVRSLNGAVYLRWDDQIHLVTGGC